MAHERYLYLTNGVTVGFFCEEKISLILSPDGVSLVIATAMNMILGDTNKRCLTRYCPTAIAPLVKRLLQFRNVHAILPYTCERFLEKFFERNQMPLQHLQSLLYPTFSTTTTTFTSSSSNHHHSSQSIHEQHETSSDQPSPSLLLCPLQRRLCVKMTTELLTEDPLIVDTIITTNPTVTNRRPSLTVGSVVPIIRVTPINLASPPHIHHVQLSSAQSQSKTSRDVFEKLVADLEPELSQVSYDPTPLSPY